MSRRAALLKKPHRGFFARRDASAVPQLFESTREGVTLGFYKEKDQRIFYAGFFGGAKQPKSEPLPSGESLAAISSKVMVFVPSL